MSNPIFDPVSVLQMRRTIPASCERVFRAWTDPQQLKRWFAVENGFTTPIADVDLQVGGRYRLGMKPPGDDPVLVVGGVYREVLPNEKLVFTWRWETPNEDEPETLVTVQFLDKGKATEIVLQHELFEDAEARDKHGEGWMGCLDQLERLLNS
jgi:uncharacterized protein YndB with AHSA1/START domain